MVEGVSVRARAVQLIRRTIGVSATLKSSITPPRRTAGTAGADGWGASRATHERNASTMPSNTQPIQLRCSAARKRDIGSTAATAAARCPSTTGTASISGHKTSTSCLTRPLRTTCPCLAGELWTAIQYTGALNADPPERFLGCFGLFGTALFRYVTLIRAAFAVSSGLRASPSSRVKHAAPPNHAEVPFKTTPPCGHCSRFQLPYQQYTSTRTALLLYQSLQA